MPRPRNPVPSYLHNKATGRAYCVVGGRYVYLGKFGSAESKAAYQKLLKDLGNPAAGEKKSPVRAISAAADGLTVARLAAAFVARELGGYSPSEADHFRSAVAELVAVHADTAPAAFGPLALSEVRDRMAAKEWTRQTVNAQVRRVRAVFRWGEGLELVPAGKWFELRSLAGLKKRAGGPPEQRVIRPVSDADVEATLPHLTPTVAAMVRFQRLTGCRPQDVCGLTPGQIDHGPEVWVYRPVEHKRAAAGETREVYCGPQTRELLAPLLAGLAADEPVFSPRRAWAERLAARRAGRKPKHPSWVKERQQAAKGPPVRVGVRYDVAGYGRAIERACERAGIPKWSPNQLRHAAGTDLRERFGLEAAQAMLGHKHSRTTERYAKPASRAGIEAAKKAG